MNRKEALKILDLNDNATSEEISKRVSVLSKKYRKNESDEYGKTLKDVEEAYRFLNGISFFDEEAEKQREYRKKHPNPVYKLLKIDEEKASNIIYYYKWHAVIWIIVLGVIVSLIVSIVNHKDPDIKILLTGEVYLSDTSPMEETIKNKMPEIEETQVQNVFVSESSTDSQMQMAMEQKFFIEVSSGDNDIFIIDEKTYEYLAKQGYFKPIDDFISQLELNDSELVKSQDLKVAIDLEDGKIYEPQLYGIDITDNRFLKDAGVMGKRLFIALGPGENT